MVLYYLYLLSGCVENVIFFKEQKKLVSWRLMWILAVHQQGEFPVLFGLQLQQA